MGHLDAHPSLSSPLVFAKPLAISCPLPGSLLSCHTASPVWVDRPRRGECSIGGSQASPFPEECLFSSLGYDPPQGRGSGP